MVFEEKQLPLIEVSEMTASPDMLRRIFAGGPGRLAGYLPPVARRPVPMFLRDQWDPELVAGEGGSTPSDSGPLSHGETFGVFGAVANA